MSWTAAGVNLGIMLVQIIVKLVEFCRLRMKKKREQQNSRVKLQHAVDQDSQLPFQSSRTPNYAIDLRSERIRIRTQRTKHRNSD